MEAASQGAQRGPSLHWAPEGEGHPVCGRVPWPMLPFCLLLFSALAEPPDPQPSTSLQTWILEIESGSSPAGIAEQALTLPGTIHAVAGGPFVEVSTSSLDLSDLRALPGVALVREPWPVSVKESHLLPVSYACTHCIQL